MNKANRTDVVLERRPGFGNKQTLGYLTDVYINGEKINGIYAAEIKIAADQVDELVLTIRPTSLAIRNSE